MLHRRLRPTLAAGLVLLAGAALADARLTIVHVNDLDQMGEVDGRGGVARLAAVIKAERARAAHLLVTHGGDMLSPSLLSGFDKGAHMVDLMNAAGLDLMVLGNHEFDFGPEALKDRLPEAKFVWLAGNVRESGKPLPHTFDTHMITVGEYKVGFLGVVTTDTPFISSPGPTASFAPVVETATALARQLREAGADLVIALAHVPSAQDRALIRQETGIDIVLAGHDHILAAEYDGSRMLLEAKSQASYVGVLDLDLRTIESSGRKRFAWEPSLRFVRTDEVAPDPEIAAKVKAYDDKLSAELDVPLGTAGTLLDSRRAAVRSAENALGNLIADAIRVAVDADIGLTNSGGIRGDRTYEPGHVLTRRDVLTELPFGNKTVKLELTGAQLKQALEHGFSAGETGAGRFPQVSGLAIEWDPEAPAGSRVTSVTVHGAPLDETRTYTLATNDFLARGGDGYSVFVPLPRLLGADGGRLMAIQVMEYIAAQGTVKPAVEGRIRPKR